MPQDGRCIRILKLFLRADLSLTSTFTKEKFEIDKNMVATFSHPKKTNCQPHVHDALDPRA